VSVFFGIVVPKGTSPAVIDRLNQAFASALDDGELRRMLTAQGIVRAPSTEPAFLTRFMSAEIPKWRELIKSAGIELQ
jgi:tripartite-type tricarboxylate transporter receptor subunit TctC